jgi:hypothetical protein
MKSLKDPLKYLMARLLDKQIKSLEESLKYSKFETTQ